MAKDPRFVGARPPFPRQQQPAPGSSNALNPKADHGESSYAGRNLFPPAYIFLASDAASYITGAVLPVTGGKPFL